MKKCKLFGYIVENNKDEDGPVVYVGTDENKVYNKALNFSKVDGGNVVKVNEFILTPHDYTAYCFYKKENGKVIVYHNKLSGDRGMVWAFWSIV